MGFSGFKPQGMSCEKPKIDYRYCVIFHPVYIPSSFLKSPIIPYGGKVRLSYNIDMAILPNSLSYQYGYSTKQSIIPTIL